MTTKTRLNPKYRSAYLTVLRNPEPACGTWRVSLCERETDDEIAVWDAECYYKDEANTRAYELGERRGVAVLL